MDLDQNQAAFNVVAKRHSWKKTNAHRVCWMSVASASSASYWRLPQINTVTWKAIYATEFGKLYMKYDHLQFNDCILFKSITMFSTNWHGNMEGITRNLSALDWWYAASNKSYVTCKKMKVILRCIKAWQLSLKLWSSVHPSGFTWSKTFVEKVAKHGTVVTQHIASTLITAKTKCSSL